MLLQCIYAHFAHKPVIFMRLKYILKLLLFLYAIAAVAFAEYSSVLLLLKLAEQNYSTTAFLSRQTQDRNNVQQSVSLCRFVRTNVSQPHNTTAFKFNFVYWCCYLLFFFIISYTYSTHHAPARKSSSIAFCIWFHKEI